MLTVVDDNTGEEIEVRPIHAVSAMASVNSLRDEFPRGSAAIIERAMATAAAQCAADGIADQVKVRDAMIRARRTAKNAIRMHMDDLRSQAALAEREKQEK